MTRKVLKVAHHRNGVGGVPFFVSIFQDDDGSKKLGVFFGEGENGDSPSMYTAVFDLGLLKEEVLEFGVNSFRGDHYADMVTDAARVWDEQMRERGI